MILNLELSHMFLAYYIVNTIYSIDYPTKLEYTKRLKKSIMMELSKYNKFPNDDMMFRDEFRFPNDYYIFNVLEKIEKIKTK